MSSQLAIRCTHSHPRIGIVAGVLRLASGVESISRRSGCGVDSSPIPVDGRVE
jgi:hypothetical protein